MHDIDLKMINYRFFTRVQYVTDTDFVQTENVYLDYDREVDENVIMPRQFDYVDT